MIQIVLIGIGAGLASALLFSSPISGAFLAFPLFVLSGLPIGIASLGWTPIAGAIAAIVAGLTISVFLSSPMAAALFLLIFGIPVIWLSRLAMLSRNDDGNLEWFPLGRILVHAAIATAIGLAVVGFLAGFDPETMASAMVDALAEWFANAPDMQPQPSREELEFFVNVNVATLPYVMAVLALIFVVFDLWLAGIVTRTSGRLTRPRETLSTVSMTGGAAVTFCVALGASFLPFPFGEIAALVAGTFGIAMALVGLAVLHTLTIGSNARTPLLVLTYVLLVVFGFPVLIFIVLGIGETFLHLRSRRIGTVPPPT